MRGRVISACLQEILALWFKANVAYGTPHNSLVVDWMTRCQMRRTPLCRSIPDVDAQRKCATVFARASRDSSDQGPLRPWGCFSQRAASLAGWLAGRRRIAAALRDRATRLFWQTLEAHGRRDFFPGSGGTLSSSSPAVAATMDFDRGASEISDAKLAGRKSGGGGGGQRSSPMGGDGDDAENNVRNRKGNGEPDGGGGDDVWVVAAISKSSECARQLKRPERVARLLRRAACCLDRRLHRYTDIQLALLAGATGAADARCGRERDAVGYLRSTVRALLAAAACGIRTSETAIAIARRAIRLMDLLHVKCAWRELVRLACRDTVLVDGWLEAYAVAGQAEMCRAVARGATSVALANKENAHRCRRWATRLLAYRSIVCWQALWRRHRPRLRAGTSSLRILTTLLDHAPTGIADRLAGEAAHRAGVGLEVDGCRRASHPASQPAKQPSGRSSPTGEAALWPAKQPYGAKQPSGQHSSSSGRSSPTASKATLRGEAALWPAQQPYGEKQPHGQQSSHLGRSRPTGAGGIENGEVAASEVSLREATAREAALREATGRCTRQDRGWARTSPMVCAFRATLVVNRQLVAAASRRAASMTTTTTTVVVAHIPMVGAK